MLFFSPSFIELLGYHTVLKIWGNMGYSIKKEFYFRHLQNLRDKGGMAETESQDLTCPAPLLLPPFSDRLLLPNTLHN